MRRSFLVMIGNVEASSCWGRVIEHPDCPLTSRGLPENANTRLICLYFAYVASKMSELPGRRESDNHCRRMPRPITFPVNRVRLFGTF